MYGLCPSKSLSPGLMTIITQIMQLTILRVWRGGWEWGQQQQRWQQQHWQRQQWQNYTYICFLLLWFFRFLLYPCYNAHTSRG